MESRKLKNYTGEPRFGRDGRELYTKVLHWRMRPSEKSLLSQAASSSNWLTMSRIVRMSLCGGGKISLNTDFLQTLKDLHRIGASVENLVVMTRHNLSALVDNPFLEEIRPELHESLAGLQKYLDRLQIFRTDLVAVAEAAAAQMQESRSPTDPIEDLGIESSIRAYESLMGRLDQEKREYINSQGFVRITSSQCKYIWQMAERESRMSGKALNRSRLVRSCVAGVIFLSLGADLAGDILRLSEIISGIGDELLTINRRLRDLIDDPFLAMGAGKKLVRAQLRRIDEGEEKLDKAQDKLLAVTEKLEAAIEEIRHGDF